MLALLKLVPLKDWLYTGIIAALLIGFGVFVHHERTVGANKIVTADAKVVAAAVAHNTEIETHAAATVSQIAKTYADVISATPAADAPHLWVRNPASSCPSSANAGPARTADGSPDVPAAVPSVGPEPDPSVFDVGPRLDKSFEDADAQVMGLQDYIIACQTAGLCRK